MVAALRAALALAKRVPWYVWVIVVLAGTLVAKDALHRREVAGLEADRAAIALDLSNARAANDTLSNVAGTYSRALQQAEIRADSLAAAMKATPKVIATARLELPPVEASIPATVTVDSMDVRTVQGEIHRPPFHIGIKATVPAPPLQASIQVGAYLDPLDLTVGIGCNEPDENGVRSIRFSVKPSWGEIRTIDGTATPDVCNGALLTLPGADRGGSWVPDAMQLAGALVTGYALADDNSTALMVGLGSAGLGTLWKYLR